MVALALINAAYILQADFLRRGIQADAFTMITFVGTNSNTPMDMREKYAGPAVHGGDHSCPLRPGTFSNEQRFESTLA